MFALQLLIVIASIYLGTKHKGVGLGVMGGLGLCILTFVFRLKPDSPPFEVLMIITAMITVTGTLEVTGGLDYLAQIAEHIIKKYPHRITFISPIVVYIFTLLGGTGHTIYSLLPVISNVAKEMGIRPEKPLSLSVIAAQQAVLASPISAPTALIVSILAPYGINMLDILKVCLPATLGGVILASITVNKLYANSFEKKSSENIKFKNGITQAKIISRTSMRDTKISLILFAVGIITITAIGSISKLRPSWQINGTIKTLEMSTAISILMLAITGIMLLSCNINSQNILKSKSFISGIQAVIGIMGISWLGSTFIKAHETTIIHLIKEQVTSFPWQFCIILFIITIPLASQTACIKIMIPMGLALGLTAPTLIATLPAINSLFFIPNYPSVIAAIALDSTGSTKIGKYVLNHSFMLPGLIATVTAVIIAQILVKFYCL